MRDILAHLVGGSIKLAFGAVSSAITSPKPRYEELLEAYNWLASQVENIKANIKAVLSSEVS